jgi:pyrimidine and pyridine-specific 5'-nucleotidase
LSQRLQVQRHVSDALFTVQAQGHAIDYAHWHSFVHGRLRHDLLQGDARMRELLFALQMPRFVFTNADNAHTNKCLREIGIEDCFDGRITFETLNDASASTSESSSVLCKPTADAFRKAMAVAGFTNASEVLFIDDSRRNIKGARELGIFTVLVGATEPADGADVVVETLHDLMHKMPELFDNPSVAVPAAV